MTPDKKRQIKSTIQIDYLQCNPLLISYIIFYRGATSPAAFLLLRSDVYDFFICAWFNENRLIRWVFQEMIKRFKQS